MLLLGLRPSPRIGQGRRRHRRPRDDWLLVLARVQAADAIVSGDGACQVELPWPRALMARAFIDQLCGGETATRQPSLRN